MSEQLLKEILQEVKQLNQRIENVERELKEMKENQQSFQSGQTNIKKELEYIKGHLRTQFVF